MTTLVAIGFLTGVASGLLGVGGGFILIPLLSALGISLHDIVAATLVYVLGTSISGTIRHLRQGTADWRLGIPLMASSALTATFGSLVSVNLPEHVLALLFAGVTGLALLLFNVRRAPAPPAAAGDGGRGRLVRVQTVAGERLEYSFSVAGAAAVGAVIGLVTGLLGIGGGFLLVPMLVVFLRIPLPIAIGTSLLSILAATVAGIAAHWSLIGVDPSLAVPLTLAGIVGAQVGARMVVRLPRERLRVVYNLLLVGATSYMLVRTATTLAGG